MHPRRTTSRPCPRLAGRLPPDLFPRYQKIAPAVNKLYEAGQQSFRELLHYFRIGSRRTLHKILRFAGCPIIAPSTGGVEIRGQNLVVIRD